MRESKSTSKKDFDKLFNGMLRNRLVAEKVVNYLHNEKNIDKAIIYNELIAKKLVGYSPEKKALAFPLTRGFLIVGIQYLAMESLETNGHIVNEGQEYFHEGSDLDTGIFSLQRNFRDIVITSGILDLLSTGLDGVSLPSMTKLGQLQLFSDMNVTVCFKNTAGNDIATKKVLEILPNATVISLPKEFSDIHHFLSEKGTEALKSLLRKGHTENKKSDFHTSRPGDAYRLLECRYFTSAGEDNTDATLDAALERAKTSKIKKILVSSCTGKTAFRALDIFNNDYSLIIVTHATGFKKPDHQELAEGRRNQLLKRGAHVLTAQHAFGGVGRAFRNKTGTYQIDEIIAYTLRTFGQGTKVAIEIALMAADAGLIRTDEEIISIGGTKRGVDTALLLKAAHTQDFFDLKIKEILCKPSGF